MIIIPIKWLFHWEYTLFSDKPHIFSLFGTVVFLFRGTIPTTVDPGKELASSTAVWHANAATQPVRECQGWGNTKTISYFLAARSHQIIASHWLYVQYIHIYIYIFIYIHIYIYIHMKMVFLMILNNIYIYTHTYILYIYICISELLEYHKIH